MEESFEIKFSRNSIFELYSRSTSNFQLSQKKNLLPLHHVENPTIYAIYRFFKHYRVTRLTFTYRTSHSNNDHQFLFLYDHASSTDGLEYQSEITAGNHRVCSFSGVCCDNTCWRKKERKKKNKIK